MFSKLGLQPIAQYEFFKTRPPDDSHQITVKTEVSNDNILIFFQHSASIRLHTKTISNMVSQVCTLQFSICFSRQGFQTIAHCGSFKTRHPNDCTLNLFQTKSSTRLYTKQIRSKASRRLHLIFSRSRTFRRMYTKKTKHGFQTIVHDGFFKTDFPTIAH